MLFQFQLIPTNGKIKITNQTAKLSIKISGEEQEDELKQSMPRDYFKFKVSIQKPNNLLTKKKKKSNEIHYRGCVEVRVCGWMSIR